MAFELSGFTEKANKAVEHGMKLACTLGHSYIGSEHLLLAILGEQDCVAYRLIANFGISSKDVSSEIIEYFRDFSEDAANSPDNSLSTIEGDDIIQKKNQKNQKKQ